MRSGAQSGQFEMKKVQFEPSTGRAAAEELQPRHYRTPPKVLKCFRPSDVIYPLLLGPDI